MQNKKLIFGVVAVIIVVVGAALFFMNGGTRGLTTLGNTSLRTLLTSNMSQKCSFSNADSSGTIYVGGGKMRGDFTSKADQGSAQSHMVIDNNIAYVWIDGTAQGYRMPFENLSAANGGKTGGVDADAKVATDCTPWQATEASFTLPTDVTFNALPNAASAQTQTQTQTNTEATGANATGSAGAGATTDTNMSYYEQKCAACNALTDATAKSQCKASFDCR